MKMKLIPTLTVSIGLAFTGTALAEHHKEAKEEKPAAEAKAQPKTVVEAAAGNEDFSTLVAAVKAAGLVDTLSSEGPFTVFAPTNAAFEKLPEGTVETLLKPENKDKLVSILTYHVVSGKVMAADVKTMKVKTVQGTEADVKVEDGKVTIDKANVVATDIVTGNGVIHVIDTVILPAE
ncbi:fasciclin domain-containing protein [Roseibacillus persicicus]|uniref:fasciclin domain-containing protein n=1 Tax=Roseibacillus persicicus TaxID=454148 RepID=UPI002810ADC3|nr:fasciclin domain-containing protein [Roseibacillus persicicus]